MTHANLVKNDNTSITLTELTTADRNKLEKRTTGWGKMKSACNAMGVHRTIVKRAILGGQIKPETAKAILEFLKSK